MLSILSANLLEAIMTYLPPADAPVFAASGSILVGILLNLPAIIARLVPQASEKMLRDNLRETGIIFLHGSRQEKNFGDLAKGIEIHLTFPLAAKFIPLWPRVRVSILGGKNDVAVPLRAPSSSLKGLPSVAQRILATARFQRRLRKVCLGGFRVTALICMARSLKGDPLVVRVKNDRISAHERLRLRQKLRQAGLLDPEAPGTTDEPVRAHD